MRQNNRVLVDPAAEPNKWRGCLLILIIFILATVVLRWLENAAFYAGYYQKYPVTNLKPFTYSRERR